MGSPFHFLICSVPKTVVHFYRQTSFAFNANPAPDRKARHHRWMPQATLHWCQMHGETVVVGKTLGYVADNQRGNDTCMKRVPPVYQDLAKGHFIRLCQLMQVNIPALPQESKNICQANDLWM